MPKPANELRILLVRFGAIGDVVLTTPFIRALRRAQPEATIVAVTRPVAAPILSHNPHLSGVELLHSGESLTGLARRLRRYRFTHMLDLHGVLRSRLLRLWLPGRWRGYSKRRVAREFLIRWKRDVYPDAVPEAERFFEAGREFGVVADGGPAEIGIADDVERAVDEWWCGHEEDDRPVLAIAPGAAHFTKRWPFEHWETLLNLAVTRGYRVIVIGGPKDRDVGTALAAGRSPDVVNACGVFDLQGAAALVQRAHVLVAGDTGLMHIATAVGTPVVVLFGPTVHQFGFLPYQAAAEVLETELRCRPCSKHGGPECPLRHHDCMRLIDPRRVYDAISRLAA